MHSLEDFDLDSFWEHSEYANESYVGRLLTDEMVQECEQATGYKLPDSFIELLKNQNGGIPRNTNFPTSESTSWAEDHIAITGIFGCDSTKTYSLCGDIGGEFMKDQWEYPDIGLYICDCPSAGHDMVALDYRKNGKQGEPSVVHVDQEDDYRITHLADDFETFIRGLVHDDVFNTSEEDLKLDLEKIEKGSFSSTLKELIAKQNDYDFESIIRKVCKELTVEKGYFALHSDELSNLMYDIQFHLLSRGSKLKNEEEFLKRYPELIVFGDGTFKTGGYAPDFVSDWIADKMAKNQIIKKGFLGGLCFSDEYQERLLDNETIRTNRS